jgi:hypothetical protein
MGWYKTGNIRSLVAGQMYGKELVWLIPYPKELGKEKFPVSSA